jgi:hypothetical protein
MTKEPVGKSNWKVARAAGALLAVSLAVVPGAFGEPASKITSAKYVNVVAHLQVTSGAATRMQVVKQNKKQYLAIGAGDSSRLIVVDVTKAGEPRLADASALSGANLSLASAESTADAPEILALLNTTNSSNSGIEHQFTSSARFVADDRHGMIYVLDGDGLWIVKTHQPATDPTAEWSIYG